MKQVTQLAEDKLKLFRCLQPYQGRPSYQPQEQTEQPLVLKKPKSQILLSHLHQK